MASTARLAVRFFGTIHHRVHAVQKESASLLTPERFPAVLATCAVVGMIAGWQVMDRMETARLHNELDNAQPYNYRYRSRATNVQRRYTMAAVRPDPRHSSLWAASVE